MVIVWSGVGRVTARVLSSRPLLAKIVMTEIHRSLCYSFSMEVKIESSWKATLAPEFEKPYFKELSEFVRNEYLSQTVYPPPAFVFNAFELTPFNQVRVVILGQDPYHGPGQAHGLSFSVPDGVRPPPSLQNIYKEILEDLSISRSQTSGLDSGNLEHWAKQGVLLLNATLTVQARTAGSHQNKGWETFTDAVIKKISDEKEHVVFMLWGRYAQKKGGGLIDEKKHLVLQAAHPSPLAGGKFAGCRHFSQCNEYLKQYQQEPIRWV